MMARPIATRCRWPPDSCLGLRSSKVLDLQDVGHFVDPPGDHLARLVRHSRRPKAMFSATFMCGNSA